MKRRPTQNFRATEEEEESKLWSWSLLAMRVAILHVYSKLKLIPLNIRIKINRVQSPTTLLSNPGNLIRFHQLTQALAGLVEIPAIALAMFIIMKVGKKWILCSTMFFAGIACLCIAYCEGRHLAQWVKTLLLMIGMCTIRIQLQYIRTSTM